MVSRVDVTALYASPLVLWVEDPFTRSYLAELWEDSRIGFLIGGGNESIAAVVEQARRDGYSHVFGLRDRDFRQTNQPRWSAPGSQIRVFVPEALEMENYLLDEDALAGCSLNVGKRSARDISTRLQDRARELAWWMACRRVLSALHDLAIGEFPNHPKVPAVSSLPEALQYIKRKPWYKLQRRNLLRIAHRCAVRHRLVKEHRDLLAALSDEGWRRCFSGKELLHHVRDWIYSTAVGQTVSERDADLAKAVARWQRENNRVPPDLKLLHRTIV